MHMHCHTQFLTETTRIHCLTVQISLAYNLEDINVFINNYFVTTGTTEKSLDYMIAINNTNFISPN